MSWRADKENQGDWRGLPKMTSSQEEHYHKIRDVVAPHVERIKARIDAEDRHIRQYHEEKNASRFSTCRHQDSSHK